MGSQPGPSLPHHSWLSLLSLLPSSYSSLSLLPHCGQIIHYHVPKATPVRKPTPTTFPPQLSLPVSTALMLPILKPEQNPSPTVRVLGPHHRDIWFTSTLIWGLRAREHYPPFILRTPLTNSSPLSPQPPAPTSLSQLVSRYPPPGSSFSIGTFFLRGQADGVLRTHLFPSGSLPQVISEHLTAWVSASQGSN